MTCNLCGHQDSVADGGHLFDTHRGSVGEVFYCELCYKSGAYKIDFHGPNATSRVLYFEVMVKIARIILIAIGKRK